MRQRAKQQRSGRLVVKAMGSALLALLLAGQAGAQVGNVAAGSTDFGVRGCAAGGICHGSPSNDYHLRGASLKRLTKVKEGDIPHKGLTMVFNGITPEGLRNLAAYLSDENAGTFEVTGTIDAQGTPVEKATVSISNDYLPETNANQLVQTGSLQGKKGIFVIPGLPAGDYKIQPSDPDYYFNPGSISVEITDQGGINCQQQSFPAGPTKLAGCDFDATATSIGLGLYQNGSDLGDNVFPNCSFCHENKPAQDTNGRILNGARLSILEELRDNDHEANAQPNGANWDAFTAADLPVLAAFLSSQDSNNGYTIKGNILDANNLPNPLNDAFVAVALTSSYLPEVQPTNLTGGNFSFEDVPPGDYDVTPKRTGYDFTPTQRAVAVAYRGVWLDRSQTNASATNTTVLDSVDFEGGLGLQFAAGKALVDSGCSTALCHGPDPQQPSPVVHANLFGFNLVLYGAARFPLYPCNDASKTIEECSCPDPLPPGEVCTQGMKEVMAALTPTERDQIAAYLSITHHSPFTLEGKVEIAGANQPNAVIPGATVEISSTLYDQTRTTTTNESGEYRIEDLWWGYKTITVTKPGYDLVKVQVLGNVFAMPQPSLIGDVSLAEATAMLTSGTPPVIDRDYEATFNIDTSAQGPGALRYAARCANCHGASPNAKARIGARLSVLRAIQIASHGSRSSAPIEEDWTAPAYGTVHDQTGPNAPINAPLPFYFLSDLQLQELAAWLATFEAGFYRTSGTIFPAWMNTDVQSLHVNLYSDTGPSYAVLTDASGDYVIPDPPSGFAPGDYLITLPGSNASPDYKKIHFGNEFLCIRQELCYPITGPFFPQLPNVDFNLSSPFIVSKFLTDQIYGMMEAAASGGQDDQNMAGHICFDDPGFDPYAFMNSLQDDHGNLAEITSSIFLAGPAVWNLSGTELEVPVAWDRTARIDTIEATGGPGPTVNWTVEGGSTILRMRYNQDAGTLKYCGEFGDRMLALTDADDILRITTGSLDGVPVLSEATIENGVYTPPAVPVPGLATWGLLLGAAALALAGRTRLRRR